MCSKLYLHCTKIDTRLSTTLPVLQKLARFTLVVRGTLAPLNAFCGIVCISTGSDIFSDQWTHLVRLRRCAILLNSMHGRNSPLHILPSHVMTRILFFSAFGASDAWLAHPGSLCVPLSPNRAFVKILALVEHARGSPRAILSDKVSRLFFAMPGAESKALGVASSNQTTVRRRKRQRQT